jgi:hypothetical protein
LYLEGEALCLSNADRVGCVARGTGTVLVAHNLEIQGCYCNGVIVLREAEATFLHCRIDNCEGSAVQVCDRAHATLLHCVLEQDSGVKAEFCQRRAHGSPVRGASGGTADGIVSRGSGSFVRLHACNSSGSIDSGIFAEDGGHMHCLSGVSGVSRGRAAVDGATLRLENCAILRTGTYEVTCRGKSSVVVNKAGWLARNPADKVVKHKRVLRDAFVVGVSIHSSKLNCTFLDLLLSADARDPGHLLCMLREYEEGAQTYAGQLVGSLAQRHASSGTPSTQHMYMRTHEG